MLLCNPRAVAMFSLCLTDFLYVPVFFLWIQQTIPLAFFVVELKIFSRCAPQTTITGNYHWILRGGFCVCATRIKSKWCTPVDFNWSNKVSWFGVDCVAIIFTWFWLFIWLNTPLNTPLKYPLKYPHTPVTGLREHPHWDVMVLYSSCSYSLLFLFLSRTFGCLYRKKYPLNTPLKYPLKYPRKVVYDLKTKTKEWKSVASSARKKKTKYVRKFRWRQWEPSHCGRGI